MHIDNALHEKIEETAQEIVIHSILDRRNSPPDYNYVKQQLHSLVEEAIDQYLDSQC